MSAEPTGARLLREILRTPAYREIIHLYAEGGGSDPGAAARALLTEDPELPLRLASASPAAVERAVHSALVLGRQLASYPEPMLEAYLEQIADDIDRGALRELPRVWGPTLARMAPWLLQGVATAAGELASSLAQMDEQQRALLVRRWATEVDGAELGRSLNALSEMVVLLRRDAPASLEDSGPIVGLVREVDFGSLREALEALSSTGREAMLALARSTLDDPVALANLLVSAPPLINDLLAVLADTLDEVELADEILAAAVLSVLGDMHAQDLGRIATGFARIIDAIHRGSQVLGNTEPAFRATATELIDELASSLDGEALRRALVALGEDGQTLAEVLADLLRQRPELLAAWTGAALSTQAPLARGAVTLLREANALPDEAFEAVGRQIRRDLDAETVVLAVREIVTFLDRYARANPDSAVIRELTEVARRERLGRAGLRLGRTLGRQVLDELSVEAALKPEAVGARLNEALILLRRKLEQDGAGAYLSRLWGALDAGELERSWEAVLRAAGRTFAANPGAVGAVVRPVMRAGWSSLRGRLERPRLRPVAGRRGRRFPWTA